MNSALPFHAVPPLRPVHSTRSRFVTVLAWVVIVASAIGILVSLISFLMVVAGSYGTANASWLGGLVVIGGPPTTLVAGI